MTKASIYNLARDAELKLQHFEFAERTARTLSLLMAQAVFPVNRSGQHALARTRFAGLFPAAFDADADIELGYVSTQYNADRKISSTAHARLELMTAKGLLERVEPKVYRISPVLVIACGPLEVEDTVNA